MSDPDHEILISAYLDDELTVEERARIEQLLATNAEARQLVDELRALRSGLQELPQHRLEIDFAQNVLRKAEQSIADSQAPTKNESKNTAEISNPSPIATRPASISSLHVPFGKRGIAWSLIAIATAILITVTTKHSDQNRQLAASRVVERSPAKPEQLTAEKSNLAFDQAENTPLAKTMQEQDNRQVADESSGNRRMDVPSSASDGLVSDNKRFSDKPGENKDFHSARSETPLAVPEREFVKASPEDVTKSIPAPTILGGKFSIQDQSAVKVKESYLTPSVSGSTIQPAGNGGQQSIADESRPVLIVHADISLDAARRGTFDQLLSKNYISLTNEKQKGLPEFTRKLVDAKQLGVAERGQSSLDVVYVEAAPEQIQNALTDLRKAPHIFSSLTITTLQQSALAKDIPFLPHSTDADGAQTTESPVNTNSLADKLEATKQKKSNPQQLGRAERLSAPTENLATSSLNGAATDGTATTGQVIVRDKISPPSDIATAPPSADTTSASTIDLNGQNSLTQNPTAPVPQRALFVLRIVGAPNESYSAKPAPAVAAPSSPAQSPAILPAEK
jgi:hypothetical protein